MDQSVQDGTPPSERTSVDASTSPRPPSTRSSSGAAAPPLSPRHAVPSAPATVTATTTTTTMITTAGTRSTVTTIVDAVSDQAPLAIDNIADAHPAPEPEPLAAAANSPHEVITTPSRSNFLRSASTPTLDVRPPKLSPRWLFADGKNWTAFGIGDSTRLEEGLEKWEGENPDKDEDGDSPPSLPDADPTEPLPSWRVPVGGDRLFEVDLRPRPHLMHPVFWKAPSAQVRRGSWFFESSRIVPCDLDLTAELTNLYEKIRPWTKAYAEELRISAGIGAEGEEKLKCSLQSLRGSYVIFSGSHIARIYQEGVSTRLAKTLLTAWAGEHGGGTVVIRGWDQAQNLMRVRKGDLRKKRRASRSGSTSKTTHGRSLSMSHKMTASSSGDGSESPQQHLGGDESPMPAGSAQPPIKDGESPDSSPSRLSSTSAHPPSVQQADLWSSLTSRLSSWGYPSSSSSAQLTEKQRAQVAESFAEAQAVMQENDHAAEVDSRKAKVDPSPLRADITADTAREEATADEETDDEVEEWKRERQQEEEDVELILCWHGIGQKLADDWKKLEFSVAVVGFQSLVRARSKGAAPPHIGGPGFPGLAKGKRLVFLPINWRATLNDFQPTKEHADEHADDEEHLDNEIGLDDIFGTNDSIPLARQVTKNLLLDIPLFLSHHRHEVLRRCVAETNRAYALYCQRNPAFVSRAREKASQPKVSMICHSLGAALAIDILSAQPTWVDPYASPANMIASHHLAYNTRSLYLVGSPAALFYYLQCRQLIARKGREFTKDARKDEALDRPEGGQWGCLSVDRIWNVFNSTDPIGTCLNGCVDSKYASKMPALAVDKVVNGLLSTLPGSSPDVYKRTAAAAAAAVSQGAKASTSTASPRAKANDGSTANLSDSRAGSSRMTTIASSGGSAASSARNLLTTWSKRLPGPSTIASDPKFDLEDQEEGTPDLDDDAPLRRKSERTRTGKSREKDPWAEKWARRQEESKIKQGEIQASKVEEYARKIASEKGAEQARSGDDKNLTEGAAAAEEGRASSSSAASVYDAGSHEDGKAVDARASVCAENDAVKDALGPDGAEASTTTELLLESASAALAAATGSAVAASALGTKESDGAAEEASKTASQSVEGEGEKPDEEGPPVSGERSPITTGKGGREEPSASSSSSSPSAAAAGPPPASQESQTHDRASARFLCLNPLGRLDYVLPRVTGSFDFVLSPAGQLLEYLGMLQAHAAYWSNESFADLVLASLSEHLDSPGQGWDDGDESGQWERKEGKDMDARQGDTAETQDEGPKKWRKLRRRMFGELDVPRL